MFGVGTPELIAFLLFIGFVVVLVRVLADLRRVRAERGPLPREARLIGLTRVGGLLAGVVVATQLDRLSAAASQVLWPTAVTASVLVAVVLGEVLVRPTPAPGPRSASLAVRRVRDHLPASTPVVGALAVLTAPLLVVTTVTAGGPGVGEAGLACARAGIRSSTDVYPGAPISVPLAVVLVVGLVAVAAAVRRVVHRPGGHPDPAVDDAARRRSVRALVAAAALLLGASFVSVARTATVAWDEMAAGLGGRSCAPAWMGSPWIGLLSILAAAALVLTLGAVVTLVRLTPVVAPAPPAGLATPGPLVTAPTTRPGVEPGSRPDTGSGTGRTG